MQNKNPSTPVRRRRWLRWVAALPLTACVLLALAGVGIAHFDWNRLRPRINAEVSEATGRRFAIDGDLSVQWHWPQPLEAGWRRWVPGVTVSAEKLVMDNPPGFGTARADMATLGRASATLRLLPLLSHQIAIDTVALDAPDVALVRQADGKANWQFDLPKKDASDGGASTPWSFNLNQLVLRQGQIALADAKQNLDVKAQIDTLPGDARYGLRFTLSGRYAKAKVEGSGKAGSVLTLGNNGGKGDYPLQFKARAGGVAAEVEGTLANPAALSGLDVRLALRADSMADLYGLTGIVLPNTPPFQTTGRLVGSLQPKQAVWDYRDFRGSVGQSDLSGHITYTSGEPRPKLTGTMASRQLRLADLGPLLGADEREGPKAARPGKVLPDAPFATDRWNAMDMDLRFTGQKIVRQSSLPIENVSVHAKLDDAQLTLDPLVFGVAQGQFSSQVRLDARGGGPLRAQVRGSVQALKLSALFPKVELMQKSLGRLDGAVALQAQGNSVAKLAATSTGEAKLYVRDGVLSAQMLDLASLNLGSVVVSKLFGADKEVHLRCAVADFSVQNGLAQARTVKLSTDEAIVEATGQIDLANEKIDLRIKPESLQWKFFSLRTPLYVRGTFADPKAGLETGPLLLRAGAAVAAVAAAPAALVLVPLTVPAAADDADCAPLLAQAKAPARAGTGAAKARR
ncbi:MAG: AsmA family protein [Acidovorax sp.]